MVVLSMRPSLAGTRWDEDGPTDEMRCAADGGCARCASVCASCGRSSSERGGQRVLCDGLCRDCVDWDYFFDTAQAVWLDVDRHGECDDCARDAALFSIGDGLVCVDCWKAVCKRRGAA
jgi:hypothetical protein